MIDVYDYKTEEKLGTFLNVGLNATQEVVVWYMDDKLIKSAYRENVYLEER